MFDSRASNDAIYGGVDDDQIAAEGSDDCVIAGDGDDALSCGDGKDWIEVFVDNDLVSSGVGFKHIDGGEELNLLFGGGGNGSI